MDAIHAPKTFTSTQLLHYFRRISFPKHLYATKISSAQEEVDVSSIKPTLPFLTILMQYQQCHVPFENLSLHYSPTKVLTLDPDGLYDKIVGRRRGGYCMENNNFFGTVLRSLGFTVTNVGARISGDITGGPRSTGWSHMVNLITTDGQKYLVDVGFGSDQPAQPIPLSDGWIGQGVGPRRQRIEYKALPQHTDRSQRVWVYSFENVNDDDDDKKVDDKDGEAKSKWVSAYSFTEVEFFAEDYAVMNWSTSTSRTSFFTYAVMCMRATLGDVSEETKDGEIKPPGIKGYTTMFQDGMRRRILGKIESIEQFKSEGERLAALEKYFDIHFVESERQGIKGMVSELKGKWP